MAKHKYLVPKELRIDKKGNRTTKRYNRIGTNMTLTAEAKEWVHGFVKGHWYLSQDRIERYGSSYYGDNLFIHFCDDQDAMFFKLTWL